MKSRPPRLVALDLDDTLAPIAKPASMEAVSSLRALEERGTVIALCSGKPLYYLTGFARQLGLKDIYLIGENGAT
ncbi:MAG: HAD family hydrolase, partial [Candidatus Enteromonas sp.]